MSGFCIRRRVRYVVVLAAICLTGVSLVHSHSEAFESGETLRYEVSWNGNRAGHGDVTTTQNATAVTVTAQAVSDDPLKKIFEIWSRVQSTFILRGFKPQKYSFLLKSNLGGIESVDLSFNHATSLVHVKKRKGDERETHAEKFAGTYDPITAIYLLRRQEDLAKPMFVDIYDGKDRSRLFVSRIGEERVQVRAGNLPAISLAWKLNKLGGDAHQIATGKLWISKDRNRIPLLLTSSPIVGTIRLELVKAEFRRHSSGQAGDPSSPHSLAGLENVAPRR